MTKLPVKTGTIHALNSHTSLADRTITVALMLQWCVRLFVVCL